MAWFGFPHSSPAQAGAIHMVHCGSAAWVHRTKQCRSDQGPIWALCAWKLRPIPSSFSVCRSSSETRHGRNLFLPFCCWGPFRWRWCFYRRVSASMSNLAIVSFTYGLPALSVCPPRKITRLKFFFKEALGSLLSHPVGPFIQSARFTLWPWWQRSSGRLWHGRGTVEFLFFLLRVG